MQLPYLQDFTKRTRELVAVMLSVFGDESADETKQRVFAVAGLIGNEQLWQPLEEKWIARTGGKPFHAKDCDSDHGDYEHTSHAENKALYRDLATMLAASGLGGWGFAIDLAAQRQVFPDAPDIAYYKCFLEVVEAMRNCAVNNHETVHYTFDMRQESQHNTALLYSMFEKFHEWHDGLFEKITFSFSLKEPRLQAADLFARETMKVLDNIVGPVKRNPRKSWLALCDTGRFHVEAIGKDWFESLKSQMPLLEQDSGISHDRYSQWLTENKLQHNVTNSFLFIRWSQESQKRK